MEHIKVVKYVYFTREKKYARMYFLKKIRREYVGLSSEYILI